MADQVLRLGPLIPGEPRRGPRISSRPLETDLVRRPHRGRLEAPQQGRQISFTRRRITNNGRKTTRAKHNIIITYFLILSASAALHRIIRRSDLREQERQKITTIIESTKRNIVFSIEKKYSHVLFKLFKRKEIYKQ